MIHLYSNGKHYHFHALGRSSRISWSSSRAATRRISRSCRRRAGHGSIWKKHSRETKLVSSTLSKFPGFALMPERLPILNGFSVDVLCVCMLCCCGCVSFVWHLLYQTIPELATRHEDIRIHTLHLDHCNFADTLETCGFYCFCVCSHFRAAPRLCWVFTP